MTTEERLKKKYAVSEPTPQYIKGRPGKDGKDGRDGIDGKNGKDGKDGRDGRDGIDGKSGKDGLPGPQGPQGERGPEGKKGHRGPAGPGIGEKWDDMRVNPLALPSLGANPPEKVIVANDGSTTVDYAIEFNGSDSVGTVDYYAGLDVTNMSVSVWLKPDAIDTIEILDRANQLEFYITNGGKIYIKIGNRSTNSDQIVVSGATQHIIFTANTEGANTRIKIYVNGTLSFEDVVNDVLASDTTGLTVGEWYNGGWNYDGVMDALYMYNVVLTDSQVSELYNDGEGTTSHPTGITEATDVVAKFDFPENTGTTTDNNCTLGAGYDMTLTNITWVEGLLGVTSGSLGVSALKFPSGVTSSLFFSAQLPHSYKEGTDIRLHPHWMRKDAGSGNVVWGLEEVWVNIGAIGGHTTITESAVAVHDVGQHNIDTIAELDGTGKKISSILQCRFYRKGNDPLDTFDGPVYISELDFHFMKNSTGSRSEMAK